MQKLLPQASQDGPSVLVHQMRQSIDVVFHLAVFDGHIPALDKTGLAQSLTKRIQQSSICFRRNRADIADHRHRRLLARATTGHAAALPSPAMNSRRRISDLLRLDRKPISAEAECLALTQFFCTANGVGREEPIPTASGGSGYWG
jgi:hypothetical protein